MLVKEALAQLFDRRVASHAVLYSEPLEPLYDEEVKLVERAVEKRRHEFRAGRHCARSALRSLGVSPLPILSRASRAPEWPPGYVGSITHTGDLPFGFAAAVVAHETVMRGLGVDAESDAPLAEELRERILTEAELEFLRGQPRAQRGLFAKLIFSGKEAFYKCQFPLTGRFLGFEDVELRLDLGKSRFHVALRCEADELLREAAGAAGRYTIFGGLILTGAQLARKKSS